MTRNELAKLLRHHRRHYGNDIARMVHLMILSGFLDGRLYMASISNIER
jgi:hypothetical protein